MSQFSSMPVLAMVAGYSAYLLHLPGAAYFGPLHSPGEGPHLGLCAAQHHQALSFIHLHLPLGGWVAQLWRLTARPKCCNACGPISTVKIRLLRLGILVVWFIKWCRGPGFCFPLANFYKNCLIMLGTFCTLMPFVFCFLLMYSSHAIVGANHLSICSTFTFSPPWVLALLCTSILFLAWSPPVLPPTGPALPPPGSSNSSSLPALLFSILYAHHCHSACHRRPGPGLVG